MNKLLVGICMRLSAIEKLVEGILEDLLHTTSGHNNNVQVIENLKQIVKSLTNTRDSIKNTFKGCDPKLIYSSCVIVSGDFESRLRIDEPAELQTDFVHSYQIRNSLGDGDDPAMPQRKKASDRDEKIEDGGGKVLSEPVAEPLKVESCAEDTNVLNSGGDEHDSLDNGAPNDIKTPDLEDEIKVECVVEGEEEEYRVDGVASVKQGLGDGLQQQQHSLAFKDESSPVEIEKVRKEAGECEICGKIISKNNLPSHRKLHSGEKPHSCPVCNKCFTRRIDLKRHTRIHGPRERVTCTTCGKSLLDQASLHRHLQKGMCERLAAYREKKRFKCEVCNVLFRTEDGLKKHEANFVHDRYTCEVCAKSFFRKKSFERHLKCHSDEKPFSCELCGLTFKSENYDKKHKEMVHGEKPASCEVCGKVVKHERYLKYHMMVHSDERAYSCEVCGQTFRRPNGLQKHKMYHHSDERPFSCDVCGKAYKDKQTLEKHKIIHNKEEHFRCDVCTRSFSFVSALNRHYQRVHKIDKSAK